jgi:hypothetical protein
MEVWKFGGMEVWKFGIVMGYRYRFAILDPSEDRGSLLIQL